MTTQPLDDTTRALLLSQRLAVLAVLLTPLPERVRASQLSLLAELEDALSMSRTMPSRDERRRARATIDHNR